MKRLFLLVALIAVIGLGFIFFSMLPPSVRAATGCTSTSCSSPDICYFPGTDQSYCALPVGGSSSCSYGCCSSADCGSGKTCYDPGTQTAYCAMPVSCTSAANCGTGYSCVNNQCVAGAAASAPPGGSNPTTPTSNPGTTTLTPTTVASTASASSCQYACCGNAGYQGQGGCELAEANNPDTVCYYAGTPASYCGNPLPAGETPSTGCAFPTSASQFNDAGWSAIDAACANMFGGAQAKCVASGADQCTYTDQTLAQWCGEDRSLPTSGYCIGNETPQADGCVVVPSEAQVAAAVGASCSTGSTSASNPAPSTTANETTQSPAESSQSAPYISNINAELGPIAKAAGGIGSQNSETISASPQITIDGSDSATFASNGSWTLSLSSNDPNTPFTICAIVNGSQSCTPNWGTTDANGNWNSSGSFSSSNDGSWTEWVIFPGGVTSNQISFTVGSGTAGSQTSCTVNTTQTFPVVILVTAASLNVRAGAPNTSSPLAGSAFSKGDTFTATAEVCGQSVDGNGIWWVSASGGYVWSGGAESSGSGSQGSTPPSPPPQTNNSTPTATTLIGPYFWGGSVNGFSGDNIMTEGLRLAKNLGSNVIRIVMSPTSDEDYQGGSCIPNFTLTNLAKRADFNAILSDPQFTTVIITAYDGTSFGDCVTKSYLNPGFYTTANTQAIENEYTNFADYLKQFNKTFIIDNWESDNDAYCGSISTAAADGGANCPNAPSNLLGLQKWFQARHAGIAAAGASNVFDAIEFNSVNLLKNANLPSVLYNVIPNEDADYYSYSSYESSNISPAQLGTDIGTIRGLIHNAPLFVGEVGFQVGAFGNATSTAVRLQQTLNVIQQNNIPYAIVWNLLENPSGFGLYDTTGKITNSGTTVENLIAQTSGTTTSNANAQAEASNPSISSVFYSGATGLLLIDGNFDASGNTVSVNGKSLSAQGADQTASLLQIPIDRSNNGSVYNAVTSGTYTVTVKDSEGTATFAVSPNTAPVLNSVQGYNPTTNVYETTKNVLNPGDTYIILYGTFASSGNGVTLGFGATAATVPANQITYQSASQINVSLGKLLPAGASSFTATVYNFGGSGPSNAVTVKVNGAITLTLQQALSEILQATLLQVVINIAAQANLITHVYQSNLSGITIEVADPSNNKIVAVVNDDDAASINTATPSFDNINDYNGNEAAICSTASGANLRVQSNQKLYGISGDYNINVTCPGGNQSLCNMTSQGMQDAVSNYNAVSGGPRGTMSDSASNQIINITVYQTTPSTAIENTGSAEAMTVSVDGTPSSVNEQGSVCNIGVYGENIMTSAGQVGWSQEQIQNYIAGVVEHEMGHCFGLAHNVNLQTNSDPIGQNAIMYGPFDQAWAQVGAMPISSDPTGIVGILQQIKSNGTIPVASCAGLADAVGCATGEIFDLQTNSCVPSSQITSSNTGSNSFSNASGEFCFDENGNNTCSQSSSVPAGEICTCFEGTASCAIAGCNNSSDPSACSAIVPSDFSCGSSEASAPPTDDEDYAQYACVSSACTYIGQGPDYSDPSCGGGCNGD